MTKDEIINCTDGQALADAIAVEVMGWVKDSVTVVNEILANETVDAWLCIPFYDGQENAIIRYEEWQPHKPTEKGKAQAIDLAEKLEIDIRFMNENVVFFSRRRFNSVWFKDANDSWQIAVLKAVLLSVKE